MGWKFFYGRKRIEMNSLLVLKKNIYNQCILATVTDCSVIWNLSKRQTLNLKKINNIRYHLERKKKLLNENVRKPFSKTLWRYYQN